MTIEGKIRQLERAVLQHSSSHETVVGKYYTQFPDETWEQAIDAHSVGFDSVEDAIVEANWEPEPTAFVVKNWNGEVVYSGITSNKFKETTREAGK